MSDVPGFPRGRIKRLRISIDSNDEIHASLEPEGWWQAVLAEHTAPPPPASPAQPSSSFFAHPTDLQLNFRIEEWSPDNTTMWTAHAACHTLEIAQAIYPELMRNCQGRNVQILHYSDLKHYAEASLFTRVDIWDERKSEVVRCLCAVNSRWLGRLAARAAIAQFHGKKIICRQGMMSIEIFDAAAKSVD